MASVDEIRDSFELLDEWEERYRYLIDLGKDLEPVSTAEKVEANRVQGCVSQVWLVVSNNGDPDPVFHFQGDSDALIVRGLVALVLAVYNGKRRSEIMATDALGFLKSLGLDQHLSPQRSNGLKSMIARIQAEAA